jgi:hypothetical protein
VSGATNPRASSFRRPPSSARSSPLSSLASPLASPRCPEIHHVPVFLWSAAISGTVPATRYTACSARVLVFYLPAPTLPLAVAYTSPAWHHHLAFPPVAW